MGGSERALSILDQVLERASEAKHHGVKGQKWGVRKDRGHEGERAKTKTIEKLDKNFEKEIDRANKGVVTPKFHNAAIGRINSRLQDLNDSPKYRDIDLDTAKGSIKAEYDKDVQDTIVKSFQDAVREVYGSNASGTKRGVYDADSDSIKLVDKEVAHADDNVDIPDVLIRLIRGNGGRVTGVKIEPLDQNIQHYGVKGMRWGRRKDDKTPTDVVVTAEPGKKARAAGGANRPASDDAKRAAGFKQQAKASTTDSLSNKELQDLVTRMNLEQQYARLTSRDSAAKRFNNTIKEILGIGKTYNEVLAFQNSPAGQQLKDALKK